MTPAQKFAAKTALPDANGCREWLGAKCRGYGRFYFEGRTRSAAAVAWELVHGPLPEGLEPDHLCENAGCVEVSHLEAVTHRVNVLRSDTIAGRNARKETCPRNHPLDGKLGNGDRYCKTCARARSRRAYERRKETLNV